MSHSIIVTRHEDPARIGFFIFAEIDGETVLMGEGDMPAADLPRNVAHWEKIGNVVRDIRAEDEPELDAEDAPADLLPGEDMDGDHASALASAGLGTDEDYGDFGGGCDDY